MTRPHGRNGSPWASGYRIRNSGVYDVNIECAQREETHTRLDIDQQVEVGRL